MLNIWFFSCFLISLLRLLTVGVATVNNQPDDLSLPNPGFKPAARNDWLVHLKMQQTREQMKFRLKKRMIENK